MPTAALAAATDWAWAVTTFFLKPGDVFLFCIGTTGTVVVVDTAGLCDGATTTVLTGAGDGLGGG